MTTGSLKALLLLSLTFLEKTFAFSEVEKKELVNAHNYYRALVLDASNMLRMKWDNDLEEIASQYAKKCIWEHNKNRGQIGENLYAITSTVNLEAAVQKWHSEVIDYTYDTMECTPKKMCGHYTQVVWADSDKMGCASHFCDKLEGLEDEDLSILVCYYLAVGNIVGEHPYKKGSPCSECPDGFKCIDNLCTSELELDAGLKPDPLSTLEPEVEAGTEKRSEPELDAKPIPDQEAEEDKWAEVEEDEAEVELVEVEAEATEAELEPSPEPDVRLDLRQETLEPSLKPGIMADLEPKLESETKRNLEADPEANKGLLLKNSSKHDSSTSSRIPEFCSSIILTLTMLLVLYSV